MLKRRADFLADRIRVQQLKEVIFKELMCTAPTVFVVDIRLNECNREVEEQLLTWLHLLDYVNCTFKHEAFGAYTILTIPLQ